jgi:hypothetical protein
MKSRGSIVIPVLIIVVLLAIIGYSIFSSGGIKINLPTPPPVTTETPTLSPSPSSSPTSIPTPSPSPVPTVKPTAKPVSGPPGSGLSTITVATDKGNFRATVLSLDLGSTRVITDTANDNDCGNACPLSNLQDFITKNGGFAGVNGTYFCPGEPAYPECASKTNSFDFPVYNTRLGHWINGGNLFWNSRSIIYFDGSGGHYLQNANSFNGSLTAGIVMAPGLLDNGNVQIDDNQSGLSAKEQAANLKVGIGIRGNTVMVVAAQNVTMQQFAYVFKSLGATGALNLDHGGSTALYYGGRYIYGPGRAIPNAIIFATK